MIKHGRIQFDFSFVELYVELVSESKYSESSKFSLRHKRKLIQVRNTSTKIEHRFDVLHKDSKTNIQSLSMPQPTLDKQTLGRLKLCITNASHNQP